MGTTKNMSPRTFANDSSLLPPGGALAAIRYLSRKLKAVGADKSNFNVLRIKCSIRKT